MEVIAITVYFQMNRVIVNDSIVIWVFMPRRCEINPPALGILEFLLFFILQR